MTTRDLCERAAALVGAAARDDLDVWPYILHRSELREPFRSIKLAGWAGPLEDLRFQSEIEDLIGWRGRGPCLVVSGDSWPTVAAVVLHEMAHVFECGWSFPEDEPQPSEMPPEQLAEWETIGRAMKGDWSRLSHGLDFHRALFHLVARCPFDRELASLEDQIPAAESYGWTDWFTIRRTFSAEVWERRHEPIRVILADPPPDDAVELFRV